MKVRFYATSSGREPIKAFLGKCSQDIRSDFLDAVAALESGKTLTMPFSRNPYSIRLGLHELRLKDRRGQYRFFITLRPKTAFIFSTPFKRKRRSCRKRKLTWS